MGANLETIITKVRRYNPQADLTLLRRAHDYATLKHEGQKRKTGEPYIIHPIAVVDILAGLEMDTVSLAAGFLHDVIEDCGVPREELATEFGEEIAGLVDGVTKLKLADFARRSEAERMENTAGEMAKDSEPAKNDSRRKKRLETRSSAENLRKILLAMAKDFRVMVIKLADRLHNMRTLQGLSEERQKKVAEETMQIFAPLAHRLGIWQVKWQLEDLAFKYLDPEAYQAITEQVARTRREREKDIKDAIFRLRTAFNEAGMCDVEIQGRPKHLWSIYNKTRKQGMKVSDLYDLIALRVIVGECHETDDEDTETRERKALADCYAAVGIVHTAYMPIPGKFDDYIAKKKSNLYQSIHTKVFGPHGNPLEVQIRTWKMHRVAEFGVAAHWAYKERGEGARAGNADFDRKMAFLRQQLFDWQADSKDSTEFLRSVVSDLFTDQVFVFTPKGDVIDLPTGATPVDFAFRIHTEMGEHLVAAKVNGRIVPLSYPFQNGDICAVITRPQATPSLDWLHLVKTSHARSKIKHYFRRLRYDENITRGKEILTTELEKLNLPIEILKDAKRLQPIANELNKTTADDLFAAIGFGDTPLGIVLNRLKSELEAERVQVTPEEIDLRPSRKMSAPEAKLSVAPDGVDGVAIHRAKCCMPLPGDPVVGYVSRGKGIMLHREGCPNVQNWRAGEPERLVQVDWQTADGAKFETGIIIESIDRVGLLNDVTGIFSENRTFINGIHTHSNKAAGTAILRIDFDASSTAQIDALIRKLHSLEDLLAIHRLGVGAEERTAPSFTP
ncbi:MAG: bifunctional (p)ppGpp synthetase/guanosine-3',5'-bis(diphosphate) 3'-pyrophosphohydrolase [Capsulimonadales bacterium]|nr:bifunctional (p)ppGpp synthetase/guanosine-3',5'-bis(diphosphate) 3'-pyrophosphohydrolase [Capsulimonadales bacterium]